MAPPPLITQEPVATLLARVRAELGADFPSSPGAPPVRVARAPGRLDVMGGIADYTGALVCQATLALGAAVALSPRDDRQLQVFSFNLYDEHRPFTFRIPLQALADQSSDALRRELGESGRRWAGYFAGCLFILHERGHLDLRNPGLRGVNLAVLSDIPPGAGVSSSAAIETAAMLALIDHYAIPRSNDSPAGPRAVGPLELAGMCQSAENRIVGAPCGIMDQVACCLGQPGSLLRLVCQPHTLSDPLPLPAGVRVVGLNSGVRHDVGGPAYARTRCAAFIGHKLILEQMRAIGAAHGRELVGDPMGGYLANLDPDDYKSLFRPRLPETLKGGEFLINYGRTIDPVVTVEPDYLYPVVRSADHHVLEARRVRQFSDFLEQAANLPPGAPGRKLLLDKAGRLMYASHYAYGNDAMLGADECDLLVRLVRAAEPEGFHGARITGAGQGGTVAVLLEEGDRADAALATIQRDYQAQTGRPAELFAGSSWGGWWTGTALAPAANL